MAEHLDQKDRLVRFIEWLEDLSLHESKVRAVLRRSLAFDPGTKAESFAYVEPFLSATEEGSWQRFSYYLVAGLWALHWREGRGGEPLTLGTAVAHFEAEKRRNLSAEERKRVTSTEQRFIALLDADEDQLAFRLRQIIGLLKDLPLDFASILRGVLYWNGPGRETQIRWAREFYRSSNNGPNEKTTLEENA